MHYISDFDKNSQLNRARVNEKTIKGEMYKIYNKNYYKREIPA